MFCFNNVHAYQFDKIERLLTSIETHSLSKIDYKNLLILSAHILNQYDKNLKLYNSSTKAYLYKNNNLISEFSISESSKNIDKTSLMSDILSVAANNSDIIYDNLYELEDEILQNITVNLDKYSRIENNDAPSKKETLLISKIVDNVLYVEAQEFFLGITDELKNVIKNNGAVDGIILDLRKNRGGYFDEAIKTADLFLEDAIITYSINQENKKQYYIAQEGDILEGKPIAVLTSENTASSAEVVVAALSEQGRATTVGTLTYGKGSLQYKTNLYDKT
jgi:hypothetical protein